MPQLQTTTPEGLILKEGDEADLRVVVQNGALVVDKVLRQREAGENPFDYKAKLGTWNRK